MPRFFAKVVTDPREINKPSSPRGTYVEQGHVIRHNTQTTFTLYPPSDAGFTFYEIKGVYLAGDFNNWNQDTHKLEPKTDDGGKTNYYAIDCTVPHSGKYKFVVELCDNRKIWIADPKSEDCVTEDNGNSAYCGCTPS